MKETRRTFVKKTGLAGAGLLLAGTGSCKRKEYRISIAFPNDGDIVLRDAGFKALAGYFNLQDGNPVVSYYLDTERTRHMLAMKWATDNGYKPSFLSDCIFS